MSYIKKNLETREPSPALAISSLRDGIDSYTDELGDKLIESYYRNKASMVAACRELGVKYKAALYWKKTLPEFREALIEIEEYLKDEAHQLFMSRILDKFEKNPAWMIWFLKNMDARYKEQKAPIKVQFELVDSSMKPLPQVIEAKVIEPKAIGNGDTPRSERVMESPTDAREIPGGDS